jgi:Effector Associated Constant Component 1
MNPTLKVSSDDLDGKTLQKLTRDLCKALNRENGLNATLAEEPGGTDTKGDVVTLGTIVLTLIGSGGVVVSLVNVLKSYVDRGRHLKIEIKGRNGETVSLTGDNLSGDQIKHATELVGRALGASE